MDAVKGGAVSSQPDCYSVRNRRVRAVFDALEREFEAELPRVLGRVGRSAGSAGEAAADLLDVFTEQCVQRVVAALKGLLLELEGVPIEH
jgi:hypothetical protein